MRMVVGQVKLEEVEHEPLENGEIFPFFFFSLTSMIVSSRACTRKKGILKNSLLRKWLSGGK